MARPSTKNRRPFPPKRTQPIIHFREREAGEVGEYKRGDLLPLFTALPKQARVLGIIVTRAGEVKFPSYQTIGGELGPLKRAKGMIVVSSLSKANRRELHVQENVAEEHKRLFDTAHEISRVHAYLIEKGVPKSDEMKARLKIKLAELAGNIGIKSRKESKRTAVKRLAKAIELVDKNPGAVIVTLVGVHNDLAVRLSALQRMLPRVVRTTKAVVSRFFTERNIQWKHIYTLRAELTRAKDIEKRNAVLSALQPAIEKFSNQFMFDAEMVDEMHKWKSAPARTRMAGNQLRLVYENIEFWQKQGEIHWIAPWLRHMVNALKAERTTQMSVIRAYQAAQRGNFELVKKELDVFGGEH